MPLPAIGSLMASLSGSPISAGDAQSGGTAGDAGGTTSTGAKVYNFGNPNAGDSGRTLLIVGGVVVGLAGLWLYSRKK